jgi:hypothetical protein
MRPVRACCHVLLCVAVIIVASCGRETQSPITPSSESLSIADQRIIGRYIKEPSNPPPRSTPTELLTAYFEQVYARRDSVLYAAMLDRRFEFVFLPQDADSLGADFWTKRLDLRSTGAMFRDDRVELVSLNIVRYANLPYPGDDCDDCRQMETTITLRVVMDDGSGEPLILAVDSPQTFLVRPDPIQSDKWVVFRQIDRPATAARIQAGELATESFSWGRVKGFFFQ